MSRHPGMADVLHTSLRVLDLVLEHIAPRAPLGPHRAELAAALALRVRLRPRDPVLLVKLPAQSDEVQFLVRNREPLGDVSELGPERVQLIEIPDKPMDARGTRS